MKKTILMGLMVCLFAGAAHADHATETENRGGKTIMINGLANGVSNEIYTILKDAGVQPKPAVDVSILDGVLVDATNFYMAGSHYSITLTIDDTSTGNVVTNDLAGFQTVNLTGAVAQELANYMEKAGVQRRYFMDGTTYVGTNVTCSVFMVGGAHHGCTITVR